MKLTRDPKSRATEIPHKWFYKDRECQMKSLILNDQKTTVVGFHIEQGGIDWYIPMGDPAFGYELIH